MYYAAIVGIVLGLAVLLIPRVIDRGGWGE